MNPSINQLHTYPFQKLTQLKQGITPATKPHIALSIGEPRHQPPQVALDALANGLSRLNEYPATKGLLELREAIARWCKQRYSLPAIDTEFEILPCNGSREAIFSFIQAIADNSKPGAKIAIPNPFYQIYEGACILAGVEPLLIPCCQESDWKPDFQTIDQDIWCDVQALILCSPGNPTGAVLTVEDYEGIWALAEQHDFIIAADECYSELYPNSAPPPLGLLEYISHNKGANFPRAIVFHSLSKRSNLPGLRSGFVAGNKEIMQDYLLYRTYHGCAMPIANQLASVAAWDDEQHVIENRNAYDTKFQDAIEQLKDVTEVKRPDAGFYLWLAVDGCDIEFTKELYREENVTVLPGQFLARGEHNNPGYGQIRIALVAELDTCHEAISRIKHFIQRRQSC